MSTIPQQIQALKNNISSLRALVNGSRDQGKFYAMAGDFCVYGCKITEGSSASDLYLALDGQSVGESHLNPDIQAVPIRHEEYPNIAFVYGEVFEMSDVNVSDTASDALLLDDAPGTVAYGRYDLVYAYIGQSGPAVAILTGTAAAAVKTAFDGSGLDTADYPSTYDPTLPHGTLPLARVYVQYGDTGVANAHIADLRSFKSRTNPVSLPGRHFLHTGAGLGAINTACRKFANSPELDCPGITYSTSTNQGAKFTATEAGVYKFTLTEIGQTATGYAGFSVNSAQLTTSIESATAADIGANITKISTSTTAHGGHLEALIRLEVGDFVYVHETIGSWAAESNLTRLTIEKILEV